MIPQAEHLARPDVTVIIPMYNEQENVETLVRTVEENLAQSPWSWELVLVNDGSTDSTSDELTAAGRHNGRVRIVSYPKNRGRGYALRRGFRAARGQIVVTTEADLSYGTDIIGQLIEALEREDVDLAIASPYAPGGRLEGVPWQRAFFSRYGNQVLRLALGSRTATVSGMTRAYRREVLDVLDLESDGKEIHLEILSKAFALGYRSCDIPATLHWSLQRRQSRSRAKTFQLLRFVVSHLLFSFAEFPFLLMGTAALLLFGLGFGAGAYAFYLSAHGVPVGHRPLTLGAVMCLLSGVQLLMFSFLAHQLRDLKRQLVRVHSHMQTLHRAGTDVG